jgi:hypothetical protein
MQIFSVYFDSVPDYKIDKNFTLKTINEIENEAELAVLQSLNDGKIELLELPENFVKSASIERVEIVYLQEVSSTQTFLQPVFLLQGTAVLLDNQEVPVTLSLPALSPPRN